MWLPGLFSFVSVPCKRWECPTCGPKKSRELARVLLRDAESDPPAYAITLTTRDPSTSPATYRDASRNVWRRLRRRYGIVEYFGFIEFTTGRARASGGHRRMHGHYLVKVPDAVPDVLEAERLVRETWQQTTGAYVIEVAQLVTPGAAMAYLSLHHQKPQQKPPPGWSGMRSRPSRGYFKRPLSELREECRWELAVEAVIHNRGCSRAEAEVALTGWVDVGLDGI